MRKLVIMAAVAAMAFGCGDGPTGKNNGQSNNGQTNNGQTNNGQTNNGQSNNGQTNNGQSNNGQTNNGQTNNGTGGLDPELQQLEDGLWNAFCEALFQCPNRNTAQLIVFVGGRFADEASCKASEYRGDFSAMQSQLGLDAGRVTLDATKIDACAAAFKTVYCDPAADPAPLAACEGLWTGTVAVGGSCALQEECADGMVCDIGEVECHGTCAPSVGTMIPCGAETCDTTTEYCGMQGQQERCFDRKAAGGACEGDDECAAGSGCLQLVGAGTCTEYGTLGEQEPCGGDYRYCETDLVCAGQQTPRCELLTFSDTTCDFTSTVCNPGLACLELGFTGGTCGAARAENEECQASFQCQIGLYCDGFDFAMPQVPGACLPRRLDGEACGGNEECESEHCSFANPDDETGICGTNLYCEVP